MDPEQEDGWESDAAADDTVGSEEETLKTGVPEGRRVIRKKRKGNSPRETLYLKRREILREKESTEGDQETAPLSVREQVDRLKEARKSDGPTEDGWGGRYRRRGARWILFVILLVAAPLVAVIVMVAISGKKGGPANLIGGDGGGMFDVPDGPRLAHDPTSPAAWFYENSVEAFEDAISLLEEVNRAEKPEDMKRLLRDAERTLPDIEKWWQGGGVPYFLDDPRTLSWQYGAAGDTGFMSVKGRKKNHEGFRAYFVKTNEGLKLDWKATTGWSAIPVEELVEKAPRQPTVVRCWLGKQPDYDVLEGHGSLVSWYQILAPGKEEFVWAHVQAGSKQDEKLKGLLNYGMIVMARKDEVRAMVRLVKPAVPTLRSSESEFEILELVTEDWVMP